MPEIKKSRYHVWSDRKNDGVTDNTLYEVCWRVRHKGVVRSFRTEAEAVAFAADPAALERMVEDHMAARAAHDAVVAARGWRFYPGDGIVADPCAI